jgi:hypothetical protein
VKYENEIPYLQARRTAQPTKFQHGCDGIIHPTSKDIEALAQTADLDSRIRAIKPCRVKSISAPARPYGRYSIR